MYFSLKKNGHLLPLFNCVFECSKLKVLYMHVLKKSMHLNMYISINAHKFACMSSQIFSSIT